ncbi:MAG: hypothetical protein PCFJNLEI_02894 [Verrucomicrobiae bacterium]|nr:hypothetical protein [Verrucomicrobiae bacterium]
MNGGVFLIQGKDCLIEMKEERQKSEESFQELLASYPSLLAGDQIDSESPRHWLLVSREIEVPDADEAAGRWSLDHLFLDQDGIPTLVEVKRSTDTRIRREVVGQMLDYAANAVVYWSVETIRAEFEARCQAVNLDSQQQIKNVFGDTTNADQLWQKVKVNLQAGKIRLVFVADEIPSELRRIIEFLNEQMDPAEVLGVEIRQYVGQGLKTLVPRVIGQTAEAQQKKSSGARENRQWDETSFLKVLEEERGQDEARVAAAILRWAKDQKLRVWWGKGKQAGSFFPMFDYKGDSHFLFSVWTYGRIEVQFQHMRTHPFSDHARRLDLARRLNTIAAVSVPEDAIRRRPSIPITSLDEPAALAQFLEVFGWVIQEIRTT